MFTEREFMTALLGAAMDYVADPTARVPPGRIFLGAEVVRPEQLRPLLPGGAETCAQYVKRIRHAHPQDDLGIVLDNCEKHVPAMRDRLIPSLHSLFSRVGYPARRNHLCLYAGTYRSTPFGIHRDDCHVLMFCGVGKKALAFWPRPYFDGKKELFVNGKLRARLQDHIADATVLEIGPLDALYWSADDWHVAVSDTDEFQAALSVGIYHHGSSAEVMTSLDFLAAITRVEGLDIQGLPGASAGRLSGQDLRTSQMAGFFERWEQLREMVNRPEEAEYRALGLAVRLLSSAGYGKARKPPPSAPAQLAGSVLWCAVPESLVVAPCPRRTADRSERQRVFLRARAAGNRGRGSLPAGRNAAPIRRDDRFGGCRLRRENYSRDPGSRQRGCAVGATRSPGACLSNMNTLLVGRLRRRKT